MNTGPFKERLEAEKARLEAEMATIGRRNPAVPNDWESAPIENGQEADLVDQAGTIVNRENNVAVLSALEAHYDSILKALSKIERGTYGICEVCGTKIEKARLLANPAATTCAQHM